MQVTIKELRQIDVKFLHANCGVRYWEDASVNGTEDTDGTLIPCRDGDTWSPLIDLETGTIQDWPAGTTADIHYKVCDDGQYALLDADRHIIKTIVGYVPRIMCPSENGYGDYVIMQVGEDGRIADWKANLGAFSDEDR